MDVPTLVAFKCDLLMGNHAFLLVMTFFSDKRRFLNNLLWSDE